MNSAIQLAMQKLQTILTLFGGFDERGAKGLSLVLSYTICDRHCCIDDDVNLLHACLLSPV